MDTIAVERDARGVATVTLARPEKRNALSAAMIAELHAAATDLGGDASVRAVVLTGQGAAFCAGGDLDWMRRQMGADAATRASEAGALAAMLGAWDALRRPVIGRVQGAALGGGVGLACICDVAVASDEATFGLTEVRLGLIPATIGPYVVARMGLARAREVFFSGRTFGADEAVRLGIVARAVPAADLDAVVEAEVAPYLKAAPGAVAAAKTLARRLGGAASDADVRASIDALVAAWEGDEAPQGVAAFFDRRPPPWAG
ncbi:hypothetical protein OCGS_0841 [Oceaniovalibus guishaninsula JLT2003]|uniref:Enoyl-CoA hydratase n=1 Tax=Oceaniovalibus guishaninsula JLT2003 TaxID=1231392 RepID=K2GRF5_9RHOB|nr:crotonase/enoyl-CoA hydratase family protein [Oceaniovalibus guishaninsula]EKE45146.1 hypothetical protein OCGS_0841 [Oceaniovalibus guishaninsula JLT2003]